MLHRPTSALTLAVFLLAACTVKPIVAPRPTPRASQAALELPVQAAASPAPAALAALEGTVSAPAGVLSNHGAGIVSDHGVGVVANNGASWRLLAASSLAQQPVAGLKLSVLDGAGKPVAGADGRPLEAVTDASGHYAFASAPPKANLVLAARVADGEQLQAFVTSGARHVDVDLISTLTTTYILERYVKPQGDPAAALQRLDAQSEADTRQQTGEALAQAADLPNTLVPDRLTGVVERLRQANVALDLGLEHVQQLLVLGGSSAAVTDGDAKDAQFAYPRGVALGPKGELYVADGGHHLVRVVWPDGRVQTLAGSGKQGVADGAGNQAAFNWPADLATDGHGHLYVADSNNYRIRVLDLAATPPVVSTLAGGGKAGDGPALESSLGLTVHLALAGGTLYFTEANQQRLRAIDLAAPGHPITTILGKTAGLKYPLGLAAAPDGRLFLADSGHQRIVQVDPSGNVQLVAGSGQTGHADGPGKRATFDAPATLAWGQDDALYVTENGAQHVRRIDLKGTDHAVTSLAAEVPAAAAALAVDAGGTLYFAHLKLNQISSLPPGGVCGVYAGNGLKSLRDGVGTDALFARPQGVAAGPGGTLYVADTDNNLIRKVDPAGKVSTLAGSGAYDLQDGTGAAAAFNYPSALALGPDGALYVADAGNTAVRKVLPDGTTSTLAAGEPLQNPYALALGPDGTVYVADADAGQLFAIAPGGKPTPVKANASLGHPLGLARDAAGTFYVVNDAGALSTLAPDGSLKQLGSIGTAAFGVALAPDGTVYAADTYHHRILKLTADGKLVEVAHAGADGRDLAEPHQLAFTAKGELYVADTGNNQIRRVIP